MRVIPTAAALALALATACSTELPAPEGRPGGLPGLELPTLPGADTAPVDTSGDATDATDATDDTADGESPDVTGDTAVNDTAVDDTAVDDTAIDDTTVDATDAADVALPADWWDAAWGHRVALTVHTGAAAVGDDHSVRLTIDHAAWVAQGISRPDGADLRLVFRDDAGNLTELDRVLEPESGFDRPQTTLWFRLAAPLAADTTDATHYCLYLDHPDPGDAPDDWQAVFLAGDGFDDGQLGSSLSVSARNSQVVEQGGRLAMTSTGQVADAAIVVGTEALPADRRFVFRHRGQVTAVSGTGGPETKLLAVVESPSQPTFLDDNGAENARRRVIVYHHESMTLNPFYRRPDGSTPTWDGVMWGGNPSVVHALGLDATYELHSNGDSWWLRARLADNVSTLFETTPVRWTDVASTGQPLWFYFGEVYGTYYWANQSSDYVLIRRQAEPEPSVSPGPLEPADG